MHPIITRVIKILALLGAVVTIVLLLCLPPLGTAQTQSNVGTTLTQNGQPLPPGGPNQGGGGNQNGGNQNGAYLYNIMINTAGILKKVNDLPSMLTTLTKAALSWLTPDTTDTTATLQQSFASLSNVLITQDSNQLSLQPKLMADLFNNATPTTLPYANDLTYTTMLGMPYFAKDPRNKNGQRATVDPAFNYIKNASGLGLTHSMPGIGGFSGNGPDQLRYLNFYITTSAIESFNAYLLSSLYAESKSPGNGFSTVQRTLITQASSSDWFSKVSSENLGVVLRQILMYQSQVFVLLTQVIKVQKQQLEAQVMNNTMLMAVNMSNEQNLLQRAMIKQP